MKHILKCDNCKKYTMKETCDCGSKATVPIPMKYNPDDKFSSYRRRAKLKDYANRGLI